VVSVPMAKVANTLVSWLRWMVGSYVGSYWETCFSSRRYSTYFLFSSSFLDHHIGHPAHHDARILLMSASSMPTKFCHCRFDLLKACFL
jgi:hypothetical protein